MSKFETAEHYCNSAVEGCSPSDIVTRRNWHSGHCPVPRGTETYQGVAVFGRGGRKEYQTVWRGGEIYWTEIIPTSRTATAYNTVLCNPKRHLPTQPFVHSLTHSSVCLTTGPQPLWKPVLHTVRSSASALSFQYPLISFLKVIQ